MSGGYDEGYRHCSCFWGTEPASYVRLLERKVDGFKGMRILDLGCGEGKNAVFLAARGASVDAIDVSPYAIRNGQKRWCEVAGVHWQLGDARCIDLPDEQYDVVVAYGLLHCMTNRVEIESVVRKLKRSLRLFGHAVLCAFNDRSQDLGAHPGFDPCLLAHQEYISLLSDFEIVAESDSDLRERHPHNMIEHTHSLSRVLARKVGK